ncbi:MAG: bifunctional pyr operon transcriptional regulator/uracil phosphoribosyltransferase, partial [Actinomycetota bacterium]|nr:bifunctional pyr operon transcriptional regulator/uracil phosphoribosyltransferase [Actinomycetota bacterium]
MSSARVVLDQADISRAVRRISHEIVENSRGSDDLIILGIPTRGVPLARRIAETVAQIEGHPVPCGAIDVTLYRDD